MALNNLASPVNYSITPVDFSPIANVGLAYAGQQQRQQNQQQKQALIRQAQDIFKTGDMDAIGEFAIANPELGKTMFEMGGIRDEAAQNRMTGLAKQLTISLSPIQDLKSSIALGEAEGRDMTHSKNMLEKSGGDPETLKKISEMSWAASDPKTYKSYRTTQPNQQKPTSNMQDFAEYERLQDTDPEKAEQFANQVGITKDNTKKTTSTQKDFKEYHRLKKSDPEAAKQFGQKAGFVSSEGKVLSVHLQKQLTNSTDDAIKSEAVAAEYEDAAVKIAEANISGGVLGGSWKEALKDFTGNQDAVTALRKRYFAARSKSVIERLPPGAASDHDVKMAMSGFPGDNAQGKEMAQFFKGMAKVENHKAEYERFKANYISDKGSQRGMINAWDNRSESAEPAKRFDGAPSVGSEDSGYRYLGGDPKMPESWEAI